MPLLVSVPGFGRRCDGRLAAFAADLQPDWTARRCRLWGAGRARAVLLQMQRICSKPGGEAAEIRGFRPERW